MDTSRMYVPNATLWIDFFKKKKRERYNQSGGGAPNIIPINEISTDADGTEPNPVKVDLVSPVEAATNRAEQLVRRKRKKNYKKETESEQSSK